jgi:hypothetical protein
MRKCVDISKYDSLNFIERDTEGIITIHPTLIRSAQHRRARRGEDRLPAPTTALQS